LEEANGRIGGRIIGQVGVQIGIEKFEKNAAERASLGDEQNAASLGVEWVDEENPILLVQSATPHRNSNC